MELARSLEATDGSPLRYWVWRSAGPPTRAILLIHGAASNHTRWTELVEQTSLRDRYDLVRPDMRGNALSMDRGRLDLTVWCQDLVQILDAEGYDQAIVVGHSLGAQIALHLAATHPQRVRALALIDPVVRQALRGRRLWTRRMEPLFWLAIWTARVLNRVGLRRRDFPLMDLRRLDETTRAAMAGEHPQDELVRRYSALGLILRHMPTANYLQQLVATAAPLPSLEGITVPVLILESTGVDFIDREVSRAALARLPDHQILTIEATHWPLTERPNEVRQAIETWIERLEPQTQSPDR
jgi:esterase